MTLATSVFSSHEPDPTDAGQDERLKHIECAHLLLVGRHKPERLAALYGVSQVTVYRWRDKALSYDDPEAVGLRRLANIE